MTCKECALWDIEAAKDSKGEVGILSVAKCLWEPKEIWPLAFQHATDSQMMFSNDGHGCPCFQKRK